MRKDQRQADDGVCENDDANLNRSRRILREFASEIRDKSELEHLSLDRQAIAEFIADQATLITLLARSSRMPTVPILSELLYTYAFCDMANIDVAAAPPVLAEPDADRFGRPVPPTRNGVNTAFQT